MNICSEQLADRSDGSAFACCRYIEESSSVLELLKNKNTISRETLVCVYSVISIKILSCQYVCQKAFTVFLYRLVL